MFDVVNEFRCPAGHKCYLNDSYVKDSTELRCEKCHEKWKYQDGAYVCAECKYIAHEKCPSDYILVID